MTKTTAAAKTLVAGDRMHFPGGSGVITEVSFDQYGVRVQTDNGFFHLSENFQATVTR